MASNPAAATDDLPEFTLRAAVAGIVFGILFGAANAYLGLRVGLTVSTSIPIAVLTVAFFRLPFFRARRGMILEANMSQTMGSASSSLASGTIFTIPALFMWGFAPPLWQIAILALLGGVLGISAMVPLRRLLIVRSAAELPYPEGTACAQVLKATAAEAGGGRWIFIGLAVGAAVKLVLGGAALLPGRAAGARPRPAQGRAGPGDRARAARGRLHPRLQAGLDHGVGQPDLGPGADPAHRAGRARA